MSDQKAPTMPAVVAKTRTERAAAALKRIEDAAVYAEQYVVAHIPSSPAMVAQQWVWPAFSWLLVAFNVCVMLLVLRDMFTGGYSPVMHGASMAAGVGTFVFLAATHRLALSMPTTTQLPVAVPAPAPSGGQL